MASLKEQIISILTAEEMQYYEILKKFELKYHWIVEAHLQNMLQDGILSKSSNGSLLLVSKKSLVTKDRNRKSSVSKFQIVATMPENIMIESARFLSTRDAIRMLLREPSKEILVVQPFIDDTFIDIYEDEIRALARSAKKLIIITRKLSQNNLKGILKIFEMYAMHSDESGLEVYEHWVPLRIDRQHSKQFIGLHAKVIINNYSAYLGSANWTTYSLSNNLELGMIIKDQLILNQLRDLISKILPHSIKVDLKQMHKRLTYRTRTYYG